MTETDKKAGLQEKLAALEALFQRRLEDRLREISETLTLCLATPEQRDPLNTLHRLLHTMAGSAGTFGFAELGKRAQGFEREVKALLTAEAIDGVALQDMASALRAYMSQCMTAPPEPDQSSQLDPGASLVKSTQNAPVYVVDDDELLSKEIALQLEYLGYRVAVVNRLELLDAEIAKCAPAAVIMDMMFGHDSKAGADAVRRIKQATGLQFPSIFISTSNQFATRLAAVRAGADGYFPKPLDVLALSDRLDVLTARKDTVPYRILIVDDDPIAATYVAEVLKAAGMEVAMLHDPTAILGTLSAFQPELVLMDVYMPECSGVELAKLIRQDNKYLDMPIVFLSGEKDFGKQLDAIESGADDFLTKPIEPAHLVSSITSRGKRSRLLRGLIMRDSLTLLYNHSAIKDQLSREMSRARRAGVELSLAMIDLDFFKHVNDTYGHPVGDHVIRALSRLLQQRLRHNDIVGRYGGEEFAVIFPSTEAAIAMKVLDKLRELFAKIVHHGNDTEFTVTFSAGIAAMGTITDVDTLFRAADEALYLAKQNGRNRIERN